MSEPSHHPDEGPRSPRLSAFAVWNLAWGVTLVAGALALNLAAGGLPMPFALALAAGLAPPLWALLIEVAGAARARAVLAPLLGMAGVLAAVLTGGMGGPMAVWCLAPLAAATSIERRGAFALGAVCTVFAFLAVVFLQLTGAVDPAPTGLPAFILGLTAMLALGLSFGGAMIVARRARPPHAGPLASNSALADAQPHLTFRVGADSLVSDLHGKLRSGLRPGQSLAGLACEADRQRVIDALAAVRAGEDQSVAFAPADDLDRWLRLTLAPLTSGALAATLSDDTAARDREEGIEAARIEAENLAAGKSRFLAGMSHELRTPLNAIMGFSDIMRNRMFGDLPGKYAEYAELIHESGSHLLDLISDVLDMSKIEAQRFELNTELHDAREPVSAALRILRHQADEAGVSLRANLPSEPLEVEADRRAIKQIVINLVSNAMKFTPAGGQVIVGLTHRDKEMELTVVDTGVGIAPEDLARLGKPYEQAGDATRRSRGTGLGLSLVRSFAELHGGQMVIESRLGEGTAVTVSMPVVSASEGPADNVVAFNPPR